MRGCQGSWSPGNGVGPCQGLSVQGLPRPFTMRGHLGSWSPGDVIGPLPGSSVSLAFPGQGPGSVQAPPQLRMHIVAWPLERPCSWRSLALARVGLRAIEGPKAFAVVCQSCVRVPGSQGSQEPGTLKGPSTYACGATGACRAPVALCGSVLPGLPQSWQASFAPWPAAT